METAPLPERLSSSGSNALPVPKDKSAVMDKYLSDQVRHLDTSLQKSIQKLNKSVEAGNYYEAQQTYKTVYARYMAGKKYDEAMELLQAGACVQLKHGQVTCGAELAVLLVETFGKANVPYNNTALDRILAIYKEFPKVDVGSVKTASEDGSISEKTVEARTRVEGCTSFLKTAIKWSTESGGYTKGAPQLHKMLAEYIWTQSPIPELGKASIHFLRGNCPEAFAAAVVDCTSKCYPGEADLVVARAVLQYCSLGNLRDANILWNTVKENCSNKFPDTPLLHFIKFLLQTLERDALPLFRMLRQNYKPSIERDQTFDEYLDEIAERFFNVRRKSGIQGMLGDIMKTFRCCTEVSEIIAVDRRREYFMDKYKAFSYGRGASVDNLCVLPSYSM